MMGHVPDDKKQQGKDCLIGDVGTRHLVPETSSHLDHFATLVADDRIKASEHVLVQAAGLAILLWVGLSLLFLSVCPKENMERLEGNEQCAYSLVFAVLLVTNISRIMALLFKDEAGRRYSLKSGFVLASYTAQFISIVTVGMIAFLPTPVLMDTIVGQRVHMLRWAAWAPLSFLMTFLTEGIDFTLRKNGIREAWMHSTILFVGTLPGAIFPAVKNKTIYFFLFAFGVLCLSNVYYRYWTRRGHVLSIEKGRSAEQALKYYQTRLGFRLLRTCLVMWTIVGISAALPAVVPFYFGANTIKQSPLLPTLTGCCIEIVSKIWYLMVVVSAYELVFDEGARTARRLEELRTMMLVVWDKSSDIVVISSRSRDDSDRAISVVNPTFAKLQFDSVAKTDHDFNAMVLDTPLLDSTSTVKSVMNKDLKEGADPFKNAYYMTYIDLNEPVTNKKSHSKARMGPPVPSRSVASLVDVLIAAWQLTSQEGILTCDLVYGEEGKKRKMKTATCEAKVTRIDSGTIMVVISDVSERIRRFEAEKLAVAETTARQKDAQANRFTKHEVKNGILAAIGLCDNLIESGKQNSPALPSRETPNELTELDVTLREVLDTVLAEAMARDVVHEVYEPKVENVYVNEALTRYRFSQESSVTSRDKRFSLKSNPEKLPCLLLDSQLLRYIHRNAISNACKYGEPGGKVETELFYDDEKKVFEMKVINSPGPGHDMLRKIEHGPDRVFSPGSSLHLGIKMDDKGGRNRQLKHSTGDGAWIMKKCAKMLKGDCSISFGVNETVFIFSCPALIANKSNGSGLSHAEEESFRIPKGTWGVAIDDSGIQRKIMARFLELLGIPRTRCKVVGQDSNEILNFQSFVGRLVKENPDDKILIIADENLDMQNGEIVSGSLSCQLILESLGPDAERVLALVRSANDSKEDLDLYAERAHGSIPKNPLGGKDKVKELIKPHWVKRFPSTTLGRADSIETMGASLSDISIDSDAMIAAQSFDIMKTVEILDALCEAPDESLEARWPAIWEKLHMLKGDVLATFDHDRAKTVVEAISKLRGKNLPDEFLERWSLIRSLLLSLF